MLISDLEKRIASLEAVSAQMVRVGKVVTTYPDRGTVRIRIGDADGLTSYTLPVLFKKTMHDKDYQLPDVGEQVLAIFLPYGLEQGFILGAFYSSADTVPVASQDKWHKLFKDGTWLEYDRASHALTGVIKGSLDLRVDTAAVIDVGGDLSATAGGDLTAKTAAAALVEAATTLRLKAPSVIIAGNLSTTGFGGGAGVNTVTGSLMVTAEIGGDR
jgi:phage baseplate assembly protein V